MQPASDNTYVAYRIHDSLPDMVAISIPLKTISENNIRQHWAVKAKRVKNQRGIVADTLGLHTPLPYPPSGATVRLTRVGKRMLDDDNLRGAMKAVRDGVADWLAIDDGSNQLEWLYTQTTGKTYAVEVAACLTW